MTDPTTLIDVERYPITDLAGRTLRAAIDEGRRSLAAKGVALFPGFLLPETLAAMVEESAELRAKGHLEDVWGTPYLGLPDESFPEGHPRRTTTPSLTWVIAYDLIPAHSPLRALYEWGPLMHFVGEVLERRPLFRFADPLGALNYAVMTEGHTQGWHYDNADFVVSIAIQSSRGGGKFECAPFIRSAADENYDAVARVMRGDAGERIEIFPMTAGTLMLFEGRNSVHRVSPVEGPVARHVALLAYDTKPDTDSSPLFKRVRYGRAT